MLVDLAIGAVGGAVVAVTVPAAYTWVKNKVVAPVEAKVAVVTTAVKKEV